MNKNKILANNIQFAWWMYIGFWIYKLFMVDYWKQSGEDRLCMKQIYSYGMKVVNSENCSIVFSLIPIVFFFIGWYKVINYVRYNNVSAAKQTKLIGIIFGVTASMTAYRNYSNDHIFIFLVFLYIAVSLFAFSLFYKIELWDSIRDDLTPE